MRAARMFRGYTLQYMADKLEINLRSYQNYEGGVRQPEYYVLVEIADLLNVSVDFLLGRDDYLQSVGVQVDVPLDVPPRRGQKR